MSVDQLKAGFDRLASTVVPVEDPYGRLVRRSQRHRRTRLTQLCAAAVAVTVAGVAGSVALQGAAPHPDSGFHGWAITSDWTRHLIQSSTRGDLATNSAFIQSVLTTERAYANPNLPYTKVLFAGTIGAGPVALVARYSNTHAVLDSVIGPGRDPALSIAGTTNGVLAPVVTLSSGSVSLKEKWTLVVAPDGCEVATTVTPYTEPTGHTWQRASTTGWLVTQSSTLPFVQVSCGGTIKQQGPTDVVGEVGSRFQFAAPGGESQTPEPMGRDAVENVALQAFDQLAATMLREGGRRTVWTGRIPDLGNAALVRGDGPGRPSLLFVGGTTFKSLVALEPPHAVSPDAGPGDNQSRDGWSLVSTGAGDSELVAVRVPARAGNHAELSDRVLVAVPGGVARVEAVNGEGTIVAQAQVDGGAAVLTLAVGGATKLQGRASTGEIPATIPFIEPKTGARVFNEPLIYDW
jgi:hypothetical protein